MIPRLFVRAPFRSVFLVVAALLAGNLAAAQPTPAARSYQQSSTGARPLLFVCDGLEQPTITVGTTPDHTGRSQLTVYRKAPFAARTQSVRVGPGEGAAGSIYLPLTSLSGAPAGTLILGNLGGAASPDRAFTPPYLSLTLGQAGTSCRWLGGTLLAGFSRQRSVVITVGPDRTLRYQTFDFKDARTARMVMPDGVQRSSVPSLDLSGGTRRSGNGADTFSFRTGPYTYAVTVTRGHSSSARITVTRGGRVIVDEPLVAFTTANR